MKLPSFLSWRMKWCGWQDCDCIHVWREDGGQVKGLSDVGGTAVRLCRGAPRT